MKLVTADEMRWLEREAAAAGIAYEAMMEEAGRATAQAIHQAREGSPGRVVVLAGPGNNGGDGLVTARYLQQWGYEAQVYTCGRALAPDPNLERAEALALPIARAEDDTGLAGLRVWLDACDVLVDALLGIGVTGPLRGALGNVLACAGEALRERRSAGAGPAPVLQPLDALPSGEPSPRAPLVVAVDLPSGLNADTGEIDPLALPADLTVTFAHPKRGQLQFPGAESVGRLWVAEIGIPDALSLSLPVDLATAGLAARLLPARPAHSHKGAFGKAMVVAGCTNYVGAARLAAEAAYRVGAGLVTLGAPQGIYAALASGLTEATFLVLPDDLGVITPDALQVLGERLPGYDALLVGPGLGQEKPTAAFVEGLLSGHFEASRLPIGFGAHTTPQAAGAAAASASTLPPLVVDADALNLLARRPERLRALPANCVLTPHPGEMARLLGSDIETVGVDRIGVAQQAAREWGCVVALKGAYTVVAAPDGRTTVIPYANAALATAGTGDVLAGAIVGLMAQQLEPYAAAVCGAYLHAVAGELWRQEHGAAGMLASELLPLLPEVMRRLRSLPTHQGLKPLAQATKPAKAG
jgi:NAD(P)H-hydrate epimerase